MTIKMSDIISLKNLYPSLKEQKLPARLSYKLVCLFNEIDKQFDIYNQMFQAIINDCAAKDEKGQPLLSEDGKSISILDDKMLECNERMSELYNLPIDFDIKYKLSIDDLDSFIDIPLEAVKVLAPFIE